MKEKLGDNISEEKNRRILLEYFEIWSSNSRLWSWSFESYRP
jgi:hypothetical protein